jgi:hypothetical protein
MSRYTVWAGKPLADQPATPTRPASKGRHAQTYRRTVTGTRAQAMAVAVAVPDDDLHSLVTVDRYDGWDRLLRHHKTTRVAKRIHGAWLTGQMLADHDEAARIDRASKALAAATAAAN